MTTPVMAMRQAETDDKRVDVVLDVEEHPHGRSSSTGRL